MKQTSNDSWYEGLDGRLVGQVDGGWKLSVYSIVAELGRTWVQVALSGTTTYRVLLRMNRSADAADAVWALEHWLDGPRVWSDRIIEVRGATAIAHARVSEGVSRRAQRVHSQPGTERPRLTA